MVAVAFWGQGRLRSGPASPPLASGESIPGLRPAAHNGWSMSRAQEGRAPAERLRRQRIGWQHSLDRSGINGLLSDINHLWASFLAVL
jgi:hypothetical protein